MCGSPRKALLLGLFLLPFLIIETNGVRYELNEDNWKLMLKGEWMVQFVAPWCPSCKIVAPIWHRFEKVSDRLKFKVATVDITKSPALSGRFFVTSLPSIYHVIDGKFRFYRGQRDIDALTDFVKLQKWKNVAPLSRWNDPNAYHMGILSYFFRISLMLKEWNARLQYEFGFSAYGSYGVFVMGTIFIGAIFGLLLITLLDFVCPSVKRKRRDFVDIKKTLNTSKDQNDKDKENYIKNDVDNLVENTFENDEDSFDKSNDDDDENDSFVDANHSFTIETDNDYIKQIMISDGEEDSAESEEMLKEHFTYKNTMINYRKRNTL